MSGKRIAALWTALGLVLASLACILIIRYSHRTKPISVTGVVLTEDTDPRKQSAVANAAVTVTSNSSTVHTQSDASGLFHLNLPSGGGAKQTLVLRIRHAGFQPLELTTGTRERIYVLRIRAIAESKEPAVKKPASLLENVRVRYSGKAPTTVNVGSIVKTFEVVNAGNVPCNGHPPCSPDGRWKATVDSAEVEPVQGNQFRNVRLSCIAGPCPFSRIESQRVAKGGATLDVSVRNWSDTVTYLLESEVSQTMISDVIRELYPAKFGPTMSFTLPATAEGPSIELEINGQDIVYPLGPDLLLSWAVCSVRPDPDGTKLYRCDLKPGFRFKGNARS